MSRDFTFGIFEAQLILRKVCSSLVLWSALLGAMCLPLLGKAPLSANVACKIFAFLRELHSHSSFPLLFAVSRASLDLPQTEGERKCENEAPFGRSPKEIFLLGTCSSLTCFKKKPAKCRKTQGLGKRFWMFTCRWGAIGCSCWAEISSCWAEVRFSQQPRP